MKKNNFFLNIGINKKKFFTKKKEIFLNIGINKKKLLKFLFSFYIYTIKSKFSMALMGFRTFLHFISLLNVRKIYW